MGVILKNNAVSTITTAISASDVGLAVAAGTGSIFPVLGTGDYFYATLVSSGGTYEIVKVTARVGDTMTIVRAQEDTTAQSFAAGSSFEARVTAASIRDTASDVVLTRLGSTSAGDGASLVGVQDAGSYYAATTVEGVLQELGASGGTVGINAIVDNFTGDGADTTFTLSKAPVSQNTIDVFINGVYQNKADFSFAGTTLTFTQAPPLGSEIEVCINTNALAGTVAASNVSYNQGSSGAVNRTVLTKLQETVSVKDFGAVGDGVTNDTAAIQAAIDAVSAAGGGILTFEPKTYIVRNTSGLGCLIAKSNVSLIGAGASTVIKLGAAAGACALLYSASAVSNIDIEGIVFDGNSAVITTQDTYGVRLENVTRLNVDNCVFQNLRLDGLLLGLTTLAKQVTIENSIFQNIGVVGVGANGIRVYKSRGLLINANYFYDFIVSPIDTNPTPGGDLETNIVVTNNYIKNGAGWLPGYSSISLLADRVLCQGNTIIGGGNIVVHDYSASGQTTSDYRVIGNSLTNTDSGITVNQGENSNIIIADNVIKGFVQFGIHILNPNVPASAVTNPTIVTNNIVEDTNTDVTYTTTNQPVCILIYNANNVLCSGNQCIKPRFAGIWASASSNITITDNFIINQAGYAPSDLLTFNGGGILVSPGGFASPVDVDNVVINGNFVYNYLTTLSGSPSTSVRVGGICAYNDSSGAKTVENVVITNNMVNQGNGIGVQTFSLESCFIDGNSIFNAASGRLVDTSSIQRVANPSVGSYSAAPSTGTWVRGDIVYNSTPASAGYVGWVCTASGTPGTWATFGLIS
jgi:hypothetical protein